MDFKDPLPDMDDMDDFALGDVAALVFRWGLRDCREGRRPMTRATLMEALPGYPHRRGHAKKMRQVYGAGFDIADMMKRVRAREAP